MTLFETLGAARPEAKLFRTPQVHSRQRPFCFSPSDWASNPAGTILLFIPQTSPLAYCTPSSVSASDVPHSRLQAFPRLLWVQNLSLKGPQRPHKAQSSWFPKTRLLMGVSSQKGQAKRLQLRSHNQPW